MVHLGASAPLHHTPEKMGCGGLMGRYFRNAMQRNAPATIILIGEIDCVPMSSTQSRGEPAGSSVQPSDKCT